jgi:hypothetical protein
VQATFDFSTAYLWGMVKGEGLSSFSMQNLGIFALDKGKAVMEKGGKCLPIRRIQLPIPLGLFLDKCNR